MANGITPFTRPHARLTCYLNLLTPPLVQLHHPDVAVVFPKIGYNLVAGHRQFRVIPVDPPLRIVEVLNHERRVYRALRAPVEMLRPDAEMPVPLGSEI